MIRLDYIKGLMNLMQDHMYSTYYYFKPLYMYMLS